MESWLPAIFGFGGVLIGSLFSLWLTKLQLNNADKRFERELAKAREDAQRQRRWVVRSEPLLKLRDELAIMATKLDRVASSAHMLHTRLVGTEEEAKQELQKNVEDINTYTASGSFMSILFMQSDQELRQKVEEIVKDYRVSFFDALDFKNLKAKEVGEAMEVLKKNPVRIAEVQELINKRLEEL